MRKRPLTGASPRWYGLLRAAPKMLLLIPALLLLLPAPAFSAKKKGEQELEESDKLPAVQNRKYRLEHEFNAAIGVLPVDAFVKGVTFSGGYAWHITDTWAVEGRGYYLRNVKTSLRDKLENNFGEPPQKFAEITWYAEAGVVFTPLYGKLSFFNRTLAYGEFFVTLNAVVARMNGGKATDSEPQGKSARMAFGGEPGFGIRGYITERLSLRFDLRAMLLYSAGEGHYPLSLMLALSYTTRSDL